MTLEEIYNQAKQLTDAEREELFSRLLSDLVPEQPNTFHNEAELIAKLEDGLKGDLFPVTSETWADLDRLIENYPSPKR